MKSIALTIILILSINIGLAQIGIGTASPHPSSILEIESTNKGFLLPRLTNAQRDAINSGIFSMGLMIYNLDEKCIEIWNSSEWIDLCGNISTAEVDCSNSGFNGVMTDGVLISSASFNIVLENNGSSDVEMALSSADITLGGISSNLAVGTPDFTNFTLMAGTSQTVSYPITGTPSGSGILTVAWANGSLTCNKTRNIAEGIATFSSVKNNTYIFSVNDQTLVPVINSQGTLATGTTISLPYTGGIGAYTPYSSPDIAINPSFVEDGSNDWTFSYNYPSGIFSPSGNLDVNVVVKKAGVETSFDALRVNSILTINFDFVNLPLVVNDNVLSNTVGLDEGGDAIRGSLSTSGAIYDAANVNDIVEVTLTEYNNLNNIVPVPFTGGMQDLTSSIGGLGGRTWAQNGNGTTFKNLPNNNYVFAFAFAPNSTLNGAIHHIGSSPTPTSAVTVSCNATSGFNVVDKTYSYYVIKRPNIHCGSNSIFVFSSSAYTAGRNINSGPNAYNQSVPNGTSIAVPYISSLSAWTPTVQFKSSVQKSW